MAETTYEKHTPRSLEVYRAEFEDIDEQIFALRDQIDALSGGNMPTSEEAEGLFSEGDIAGAYRLQTEHVRATLTTEQAEAIQELLKQDEAMLIRLIEVGREGLPSAEAVFAERCQSIIDSTNWPMLFEDVAQERFDPIHIDWLLKIVSKPNEYGKGDFGEVIWSLDQLDEVATSISDYKIDQTAEHKTEQYVGNGNLVKTIDNWLELTTSAIDYVRPHRRAALRDALPVKMLQQFRGLAQKASLDGDENALVPGVIADALESTVGRRMMAFDAFDRAHIIQHQQERANALMITGGKALTKTTGVENAGEWLNEIFNEWPDWMSRGIGFVEFLPTIPDEAYNHATTEDEDVRQGKTVADWAQSKNSFRVSTREDDYNRIADIYLQAGMDKAVLDKIEYPINQKSIKGSIVHEMMHNAHMNALPVSWLRAWQETILTELVHVTDYVAHNYNDEAPQQAYEEDLCDSAKEYRYRPAHLAFISRGRFLRLQELTSMYDEAAARALFQLIDDIEDDPAIKEQRLANLDEVMAGYIEQPRHHH